MVKHRKIVSEALQQLTATTNKQREISDGDSLNIDVESEVIFRAPLASALTIQTSPVPSTSSYSTDTASESGSAFNSPNEINRLSSVDLNSTASVKDFSRLVVVKISDQKHEQG